MFNQEIHETEKNPAFYAHLVHWLATYHSLNSLQANFQTKIEDILQFSLQNTDAIKIHNQVE